jgi:hypothetical protein
MPQKGQEDVVNVDMDYYLRVFTQRVNLWQTDDGVQYCSGPPTVTARLM